MTNDDTRSPGPDDRTPEDQEGVAPDPADTADTAADAPAESSGEPAGEQTAPLSSEPQNPWGSPWGTPPADSLNPYGSPSSPPSGSPETPAEGTPGAPPAWEAGPPPPSAEGPAAAQPPSGPPGETPPPPVSGGLYGDAASAPPAYPSSGDQYGGQYGGQYGAPPPPQGGYGSYGGASYGTSGFGMAGYGAQTHGTATTALILGILSLVCCGLLGIPAYILGRRAEREIQASGGRLTGEGLAQAGWLLGVVSIVLMILGLLFFAIAMGGSLTVNSGSGM